MEPKLEQYVQRRVRELIAANWTDADILRQLDAVAGRKAVQGILNQIKAAQSAK
jgi:hypothetical protein